MAGHTIGTGLAGDVRYAGRVLARSRGFTAVAVLSLAVAIGANTAVYSVARYLLLDPLPVRSPDELSLVYWSQQGNLSVSNINSSGHTDPATGASFRSN